MYTDDTDLDCIKYYHFASTQHLSIRLCNTSEKETIYDAFHSTLKKCTGTSNVTWLYGLS